MRRMSFIVGLSALLIGLSPSADTQVRLPRGGGGGGGWVHLGNSHVDGNADHDKINCHGKDTYRRLRIQVTGSPVQFDRINVVYGNHNQEPLPFRFRVTPGAGRTIDLRGGNRDIAYVEFWYQKASWSTKPEVRLYGQQ
jgi:hypothetical protein